MGSKSDQLSSDTPRRRAWIGWLGIFASFAVLYAWTAQRGPAWQDSGIFQWRILNFDLHGELGLALSHPLLILTGKAFSEVPVGPLAWRTNLPAALAGAIAAANIGMLVWRLTRGKWLAACVAAATYGLAHTPWWLATICESQAINAALFTTELHVLASLLRRPAVKWAALLGLVNGLGLMTHNLSLLALPAYGLAVIYCCWKRKLTWAAVPAMIGCYLAGSGLFLAMVISRAGEVGAVAAVRSALFGQSWQSDVMGGSARAIVMGFGYIGLNFPNLALPLLAVGVWVMARQLARPLLVCFAYLFGIYFLFAIRYTVPDQFMFFLPLYALMTVGAGVGFVWLSQQRRLRWLAWVAAAAVVITPAVYGVAPAVWKAASLPVPGRSDLPFRDPARYWLTPWKQTEDSAGLFAVSALEEVPPASTIVADNTSIWPLRWIQRVGKLNPTATILPVEQADRQAVPSGTPNVYVASDVPGYFPEWMGSAARLSRGEHKVLYRVVWSDLSDSPGP